jgi:dimethylsulfone monooxygenase
MRSRRFGSNPFELGIFASNVHNGLAKIKTTLWDNSWENNVRVARLADDAGIEFLLPLGQWQGKRGYPAEGEDEGGSHETLTWAAGILAATSRIAVFGTLHVAYVHPVFAAKQVVTAHHIGQGRFGLNVVSGRAKEYAMFGAEPGDHDAHYDYTDEWVSVVKRMWSETVPFDHAGTYFNLKGVLCKPKPFGAQLPMVISAGHSVRGRTFAMRHADALFTSLSDMESVAGELRGARALSDRSEHVPIYASSHLVCRPTREAADEYYHHLVYELGDWSGVESAMQRWALNRTAAHTSPIERLKERLVSGVGTFVVRGSYDDAAQTYKALHDAGLDGVAIGLFDYIEDFERLRDEIVPRLERLGLRKPAFAGVA